MAEQGRRGVLERVAAGVDQAFGAFALGRSRRSRARSPAESLGPAERIEALGRLCGLYEDTELLATPDAFFLPPPAIEATARRVRAFGGEGEVLDVSWPSLYQPFVEAVSERFLADALNLVAHARVVRHRERGRPAVLLLHGYLGGQLEMEQRAWPVRWLFERGFDVALPVLPFHGLRKRGRRPTFPHSDPRVTIEGFRQAILDLRTLVRWLEAGGASAVGAMGMSLGGYTTALLATVEPRLAFAVPFIPLGSIADFARDGGRLIGSASEQEEQHRLLETVHRVVSPLARPALVPKAGRLVVAARSDRITPATHAERIARHFEAPLVLFPGAHLVQVGRSEGFRAVGRMLGALGYMSPR